MPNQPSTRKSSGRLRIKLEPPICDQCRLNKMSGADSAKRITYLACGLLAHGPLAGPLLPPPYLETQVGVLERKLRETLPGVNLNRELEALAQIAAPPRASQISANSSRPQLDLSPSANTTSPPRHPPTAAQDVDSYGVSAAPLLLRQVRLASEVKPESELLYNRPLFNQTEPYAPLRNDTYWSETASTRPKEPRYHGQSSGEILLRDAKELKQEFEELSLSTNEETLASRREGPLSSSRFVSSTYPTFEPISKAPALLHPAQVKYPRARIRQRRPEFWQPTPPEQRALSRDVWATSPPPPLSPSSETYLNEVVLPPPDLIKSLVDLFFIYVNPPTPIFHRQTFDQELASGTHLLEVLQRRAKENQNGMAVHNPQAAGYPDPSVDQTRGAGTFARVVLLVCACASRWSEDPRVLSSSPGGGAGNENNYGLSSLSAGYSFFRQVDPSCRTMCAQAGLWDVQIFLLSALYLHGSSASYGAWIVLGTGIRLAQDIGAHRKKDEISIENELSKRSFCGSLGRPPAMQDIDSDLENPIEVDDEHWPIGGEPNQPPNKPSKIACLTCLIGLTRVLGRAQQTVFATAQTKRQIDLIGPEKEKMLLNDLQYHMKQWQLTVPPHRLLSPSNHLR
ncbi:hypothetical protein FRC07_003699 [Ceratobasidium sp. 392]|nr:hypothetical protein FRC07_003699 [Ceratobasidium sp. 392]